MNLKTKSEGNSRTILLGFERAERTGQMSCKAGGGRGGEEKERKPYLKYLKSANGLAAEEQEKE